jgi:hypothetical protein
MPDPGHQGLRVEFLPLHDVTFSTALVSCSRCDSEDLEAHFPKWVLRVPALNDSALRAPLTSGSFDFFERIQQLMPVDGVSLKEARRVARRDESRRRQRASNALLFTGSVSESEDLVAPAVKQFCFGSGVTLLSKVVTPTC